MIITVTAMKLVYYRTLYVTIVVRLNIMQMYVIQRKSKRKRKKEKNKNKRKSNFHGMVYKIKSD